MFYCKPLFTYLIYYRFRCLYKDYVEKTWKLAGEEQRLLCSNMSSTGMAEPCSMDDIIWTEKVVSVQDHDLTGQIVWPASVLLTWFLRWYR